MKCWVKYGAVSVALVLLVNGSSVSVDQWYCRFIVLVSTILTVLALRLVSDPLRALSSKNGVPLVLAVQIALGIYTAWRYSFCWTESGLLPAGVYDWYSSSYDVFRVNPPLLRMWAAMPLILQGVSVDVTVYDDIRLRPEWPLSSAFVESYTRHALTYLREARVMVLPVSLIASLVIYKWTKELYGRLAGVFALVLWVFFPMTIAFFATISGDIQAASLSIWALYVTRSWLSNPTLQKSIGLGILIGASILMKTSLLTMPVFLLIFLVLQFALKPKYRSRERLTREALCAFVCAFFALLIINAAYCFEGSFKPLGKYSFISKAFSGASSDEWKETGYSGNRFANTMIGLMPVPLPEDLVLGVDLQKWDFDRVRWSYLNGKWRTQGWWYYYLYGIAFKSPIGLLGLATVVLVSRLRNRLVPKPEECLLLAWAVWVICLASCETGLNRHLRYIFPAFPPLFVLIGYAFRHGGRFFSGKSFLCAIHVFSSAWCFPHSMSYCNELFGGPLNGARYFAGSNIDWGQDLLFLRDALAKYDNATVASTMSHIPLRPLGLNADNVNESEPYRPGIFAVDQESLIYPSMPYQDFATLRPIEMAGYGFKIFRLKTQDCRWLNERRELRQRAAKKN